MHVSAVADHLLMPETSQEVHAEEFFVAVQDLATLQTGQGA